MSLSIFSYKPPHDGTLAHIENGVLKFSIEGEKDSHPRFSGFNSFYRAMKVAGAFDVRPDVIAWGGGSSPRDPMDLYDGIAPELILAEDLQLFGKKTLLFRSSHERAHIFSSYGLSPFPQGQPVYALVWEGGIGAFYEIDEKLKIHPFGTVLRNPGHRYSIPYSVANPQNAKSKADWFLHGYYAGKTMALAAYGEMMSRDKRKDWSAEIDAFLKMKMVFEMPGNRPQDQKAAETYVAELKKSRLFDIGVESEDFKDFTYALSTKIYDLFHHFAKQNLKKGYPLIISGGCGLNCDWNTQWKESGLFSDLFVPPCTNDSGIAIGMAVDAQRHVSGNAKLDWSVYCGESFVEDAVDLTGFRISPLNLDEVAALLEKGKVLAWVEGRYEMGPRALCHRSLIAAPFKKEMTDRLNKIKNREPFRPIAPICLEEEVSEYFDWRGASPFMLYFQRVRSPQLQAVTHVNRTARVQTVNDRTNPRMASLLRVFKKKTGFGVLCNTSLNFAGMGFINRLSDLVRYALKTGLDGFVVEDRLYLKRAFDYRRPDSVASLAPSRPYLSLSEPVVTYPLTNKTETEITPQAIRLKFETPSDICVLSFSSNVGPFAAPGVVDVKGYGFFQFQAQAPKGLKFFVTMTESGANAPDAGSFSGVNGADGERYFFPTQLGTGDWATYRLDLATLNLWRYWGNQKGNNILDLQGLRSIEFFVLGNQKGEIQLRHLEFTV